MRRSWLRWFATACQALAVLVWLLMVLRYQYGAASLQALDEVALDLSFLGAVTGAAIARALDRRAAAERRLFLFRLTLLVGATALAVIAAEYAARLQYRHARTSGNARDYIAHGGAWSAGPSNGLGFRDREVTRKSPERYRIVAIGDSFTWGQGIEREERFSNLLEGWLGPRYEVFNFGVPGNNMREHLTVLDRALEVSPDFVLLQLYINDFETRQMLRPHAYPLLPGRLDRDLGQSSLLYVLVRNQWSRVQEMTGVSESYVHYMERNLRDPNGVNSVEAFGLLKQFFERARAAGAKVGVVLFPETDALGAHGKDYPFGYLHDGVRRACRDENVGCLDLLPLFSTFADPRSAWVSPLDAHPNAMANRRAANEILHAFSADWQY
jgi:lysophospholipase L1-like esterase